MSTLNPVQAAANIKNKYIQYLLTTFKIDDKNIEKQFKDELYKDGKLSKGPYLEVSNSFKKGRSINELIEDSILVKEFNNFKSSSIPFQNKDINIYFHQEQAIIKATSGENIIVSTGTGSGKTESFLIPILNQLLKEKEEGKLSPGVRALILYPMNALVNDQIERFRKLLKDYPEITFGKFTGETEQTEKKAKKIQEEQIKSNEIIPNEIISRDEMRENPPHILITNYAMLEYLMLRPEDNVFFNGPYSKEWKFIVLDEAHTYKGALGIEVSMLLRRLKETIKKTGDIQFILTSASLGRGVEDNPDIVKFAENLTGENFKEENIIGATRIEYTTSGEEEISFKIYKEILENLDQKEKIIQIFRENNYLKWFKEEEINNFLIEELLYELIRRDQNFYKLRNLLREPKEISEVYKEMNVNNIDDIFNFIEVASKAKKDGIELFRTKYHYFFKALEGGFLSLVPEKKFYLNRMEEVEIENEKIKVFEISTCKFCNEIYLVGELKSSSNGNYKILNQKNNYITEDVGADLEYFLLKSSIIDKNEDEIYDEDENIKEEQSILCGKCGAIFNKSSLDGRCSCGEKYLVDIIKIVRDRREKKPLHTCRACGSTNPASSILKRFIIGAEGATAALGTALHESLPDKKIKENSTKPKEIEEELNKNKFFKSMSKLKSEETSENLRQFLVFSDSRQSAAYYATYMEESYNKFLRKRIVYEVVSKSDRDLSISELINEVTAIFEQNKIFNQNDCREEAYKSVFFELFSLDRRYSLEGLGLVQFYINFNEIEEILDLTFEERYMMLQECCNFFKHKGAVKYKYNISNEIREYFTYSLKETYINLSDSKPKENIFSWTTTKNNNSRVKFIEKISNLSISDSNELLEGIWKYILNNPENPFLIGKAGNYQLDLEKIKVRFGKKVEWYYCDCCKKITPNNIKDICPTYGCIGTLKKVDPEKLYSDNHYRNLTKSLLIKPFKINEHTAQLDSKLAYDIQKKFTNKKINVLSCSTTFEMGVDVGELETVFMRNMPPSPANYSQRAGRAGRRGSSSAFTLTFCSQKSHDFTFYKNPIQMIKGMIPPPKFDINNQKIIIRHIYAVCFSYFWKKEAAYYGDGKVLSALSEEVLVAFKKYLNSKPKEIKQFLTNILNKEIQKKLGIESWSWLNGFLEDSPEGALYRVKKEFFSEIEEIEEAELKIKELINTKDRIGKEMFDLSRIQGMKSNIESKTTINYFAQKNLLPRYGFPVDTVELHSNNKDELRLSRDLGVAISEYAPEGQVIANGKLLTSRFIRKVPSLNWKIYNYGICKDCKTLNHKIDTTLQSEETKCLNCGNEINLVEKYIIPEFGFRTDITTPEKAGTKKPKKLYSSDIYPIENKNAIKIAEKETEFINGKIVLKSFKDEEMGIITQNKFFICEVCGYGEKASGNINQSFKKSEHKNPSGYTCTTSLKPYNLGHKFKTDIVTISFDSKSSLNVDESILYGLLEGISNTLNIDRSDISGCLKKIDNKTCIVVYDTVPGGAGHVKRILENDNIIEILKNTYKIVSECECGEETSCYSCLRDYSNQKYHETLVRGAVKEFLENLMEKYLKL
ncbi:DEAD/DEAH box helicase [Cetobacterium sp.]|uniref:DEAD/DEAH box helicase n=1 Tax=Cetobacterium sp. TaxID=2071632 RepID=UPI003EE52F29